MPFRASYIARRLLPKFRLRPHHTAIPCLRRSYPPGHANLQYCLRLRTPPVGPPVMSSRSQGGKDIFVVGVGSWVRRSCRWKNNIICAAIVFFSLHETPDVKPGLVSLNGGPGEAQLCPGEGTCEATGVARDGGQYMSLGKFGSQVGGVPVRPTVPSPSSGAVVGSSASSVRHVP